MGKTTRRDAIRDAVRDQIVEALSALPAEASWKLPWRKLERPINASTGRAYSGINILTLTVRAMALGVSGGGWLTYKQAQALGGQVRRGEQGVKGIYYTSWTKKKESSAGRSDDELEERIPVIKGFTLFHVTQVDGLPEADLHLVDAGDEPDTSGGDFTPAHDLVRLRELELARLVVGGDTAAYAPSHDTIFMPAPSRFAHHADWWRVYLHELVHATGHPSRLARAQSTRFGSRTYAFEELVAELGAALLSHTFGVSVGEAPGALAREHARDHAAYISSWIACLKADSGALFDAWALALGACDFLELELAQATFAANAREDAVA